MNASAIATSVSGWARTAWVLPMVVVCLFMGACSNVEDDVYSAFKCGRVAMILDQRVQARVAAQKIESTFQKLPKKYLDNQSQYFLKLSTEFTDDLALYKLSPQGQAKVITDVYESGTCQKLYQ